MKSPHPGLRAAALTLALVSLPAVAGRDAPAVAPAPSPAVSPDPAELERAREELRRAREELARAAREMARAAREAQAASPRAYAYEFVTDPDRALLGVTIADGPEKKGQVSGVRVTGVTPGSGADKAGLKSGDLLLSANGTALASAAGDPRPPVLRLRDVMAALRPGDEVKLDYEREGRRATVVVVASRPQAPMAPLPMFGWSDDEDIDVLIPPLPPGAPAPDVVLHRFGPDAEASLQLARIDDDLAGYFKTRDGVLVVRAPDGGTLGLKSGDVILRINGRSVASPVAAWEELDEARGKLLRLEVMRKGQALALEGEMPDLRHPRAERRIVIRHAERDDAGR